MQGIVVDTGGRRNKEKDTMYNLVNIQQTSASPLLNTLSKLPYHVEFYSFRCLHKLI